MSVTIRSDTEVTREWLIDEYNRLQARTAKLETALTDCVTELTELVNPSYGPLVRARAVLNSRN